MYENFIPNLFLMSRIIRAVLYSKKFMIFSLYTVLVSSVFLDRVKIKEFYFLTPFSGFKNRHGELFSERIQKAIETVTGKLEIKQ